MRNFDIILRITANGTRQRAIAWLTVRGSQGRIRGGGQRSATAMRTIFSAVSESAAGCRRDTRHRLSTTLRPGPPGATAGTAGGRHPRRPLASRPLQRQAASGTHLTIRTLGDRLRCVNTGDRRGTGRPVLLRHFSIRPTPRWPDTQCALSWKKMPKLVLRRLLAQLAILRSAGAIFNDAVGDLPFSFIRLAAPRIMRPFPRSRIQALESGKPLPAGGAGPWPQILRESPHDRTPDPLPHPVRLQPAWCGIAHCCWCSTSPLTARRAAWPSSCCRRAPGGRRCAPHLRHRGSEPGPFVDLIEGSRQVVRLRAVRRSTAMRRDRCGICLAAHRGQRQGKLGAMPSAPYGWSSGAHGVVVEDRLRRWKLRVPVPGVGGPPAVPPTTGELAACRIADARPPLHPVGRAEAWAIDMAIAGVTAMAPLRSDIPLTRSAPGEPSCPKPRSPSGMSAVTVTAAGRHAPRSVSRKVWCPPASPTTAATEAECCTCLTRVVSGLEHLASAVGAGSAGASPTTSRRVRHRPSPRQVRCWAAPWW